MTPNTISVVTKDMMTANTSAGIVWELEITYLFRVNWVPSLRLPAAN